MGPPCLGGIVATSGGGGAIVASFVILCILVEGGWFVTIQLSVDNVVILLFIIDG